MSIFLPLLAVLAPAQATAAAATVPSPTEIVTAAPAGDWADIAASDLLVLDLAPDRDGKPRRVVIQLMPPPFSQGWVDNIRKLAAAHWWDGLSVNRVQDNYVVQWGDANGDDKAKARMLPPGLADVPQSQYSTGGDVTGGLPAELRFAAMLIPRPDVQRFSTFTRGWPVSGEGMPDSAEYWPIHCYGMVGVGRNLPPDTGTGAELYTVIGHAPRHLDRNIALVGRVVAGIEHLSSLPRGTGPLGFYEKAEERVPIRAVRLASDLPEGEQPRLQYLSTESASFARYADARANRRDPFFIVPAGGADICNIPVPIRKKP
ncbi:peptidylprolyl isomerase [Sphingomonas psychrolutea]|uniref:peptidylprolyl isomerase n=1 Tax=Sphingomonas psychrolutea TaxID=1259676 RepID=UPI001669F304|nr:peptidylprolyl isomerase [Sphingomonas psychrolutea]